MNHDSLPSCNFWVLRCKDTVMPALGRGETPHQQGHAGDGGKDQSLQGGASICLSPHSGWVNTAWARPLRPPRKHGEQERQASGNIWENRAAGTVFCEEKTALGECGGCCGLARSCLCSRPKTDCCGSVLYLRPVTENMKPVLGFKCVTLTGCKLTWGLLHV